MKVTIDSIDSLSDALRVLGALYDVTLTVSEDEAASEPLTATSPVSTRKVRPRKPSKRHAVEPAVGASNVEMRSWALENGMTVSNRGRLPGRVVEAYRDAHQSR